MRTCIICATRLREQGRAGRRNVEAEGREASIGISARLTDTQLGNSKVTEVGTQCKTTLHVLRPNLAELDSFVW
jgi:hypothetical protein